MELQGIIVTALSYIVCVALSFAIFVGFLCNTGEIRVIKNPSKDPNNPDILKFNVNPNTWLNRRYVLLRVRNKNK